MTDKIANPLAFHQKALNVNAHRQQVLASNIANADTPHFKARDIDFKSMLQGALRGSGGGTGSLPLMRTAPAHLQASGSGLFGTQLKYRQEQQSSVDGNTVNLDTERAQFAENAVHYEANLSFINQYLRAQREAITGQ
ncbi:MAG: flagellar basal body rod protein FlgB [Rhodocyclaceae bacterium]|jgi:flagellar basal-body rod protein FlgB